MIDSEIAMIARVAVAALLGAMLGIEREAQHKTAGLRTHTLVAAGAALFTVVGASVSRVGSDVTRVAAQVVTGIGFIGAGGMIRSGFTITGITTAATLWFAAALGVAAGFGLFGVAAVSLAIALLATVGFIPMRTRIHRGNLRPVLLEYVVGHGTLGPLFDLAHAAGGQVHIVSIEEDNGRRQVICELGGISSEAMHDILASLRSRGEVIKAIADSGER
jgi:putative Mg2+ transporter-C (MgtC) family protein